MDTYPKLSFVCPVKWDAMRGDERERFCEKCQRSVINISRMTKSQRAALLEKAKSQPTCVSYLQRIETAKPLGAWSVRRRAAALTLFGLSAAGALVAAIIVDMRRTPLPEDAGFTTREKMEYYYYSSRYRVEQWVDDVRVFFGGKPRFALMFGDISPAMPPATAAPPATAPAPATNTPVPVPPSSTNTSQSDPSTPPAR